MSLFRKLFKKKSPTNKIPDILTGLVINSDKANTDFINLIGNEPEDKQSRLILELLYFRIYTIDFATYQMLSNSDEKAAILNQFHKNLIDLFQESIPKFSNELPIRLSGYAKIANSYNSQEEINLMLGKFTIEFFSFSGLTFPAPTPENRSKILNELKENNPAFISLYGKIRNYLSTEFFSLYGTVQDVIA